MLTISREADEHLFCTLPCPLTHTLPPHAVSFLPIDDEPLAWFDGRSPQHVVGHHIYTNVFGADPDLPETAEGDPRRLVHRQKYASFYKYQHIYLPPLYGILGLKVGF